jgi:DHA2 family multidrug resistance protein
VPITLASYVGLPPEKNSSAAGLINFMRNIGSSIGTSMVTTLIAQRSQFHQSHLVGRIAPDNPTFQAQLDALGSRLGNAGLGAYEGHRQALARIYQMVQSQAATLAYVDTFWLLGFGAGVMVALSFVLRKNDPRAGGATVRDP